MRYITRRFSQRAKTLNNSLITPSGTTDEAANTASQLPSVLVFKQHLGSKCYVQEAGALAGFAEAICKVTISGESS
jgi:hypothetical protein